MRKTITVAILITAVTATAGVNVYFTPGVWSGLGTTTYKASAYADSGFSMGNRPLGYELSVNYRNWYGYTRPFNMLNIDHYAMITLNAEGPIHLFVAPMLGFGFGWYSSVSGSSSSPDKYNNIGVGGRCGVGANYADGKGLVELYFDYRGGIVLGERSGDYYATTKFGVDASIPISSMLKIKLAVGAIADNFGTAYMASDYFHTSPYILVGPDIYF